MGAKEEVMEWIPLSITHVLYPKGDIFGELLAYLSLTPFAIIVAFITLTLFTKDIHVIFFFGGQLLNEVLCVLLKRVFGQSRPVQIAGVPHSNKSYGMPSQHSQFQTFFTVYALLFIITRLKRRSVPFKCLLIFSSVSLSACVIYSRIYLLYHYWAQCIVGIIIGSIFAITWYLIVSFICEPFIFPILLNLNISRYFGLCSIYIEPYINITLKNKKF